MGQDDVRMAMREGMALVVLGSGLVVRMPPRADHGWHSVSGALATLESISREKCPALLLCTISSISCTKSVYVPGKCCVVIETYRCRRAVPSNCYDDAKDCANKPLQISLVRYCTVYVSSTRYLAASVFRAPADETNGIFIRETSEDADLRYLTLKSTVCNIEAPSRLRMRLPSSDSVEKA